MAVPPVSDALPDANCSEDFVLALILSVRAMAPAKRSSRGRRALFNYISHFMQLATCLMHLGQHQAAVDARWRPRLTDTCLDRRKSTQPVSSTKRIPDGEALHAAHHRQL